MKKTPSFRRRSSSLRMRHASPFRGRAAARGFTLIEIVVVIALIGLILGVVANRIMGSQARAEIDQYEADVGGLPDNLEQLVTAPSDASGWLGPYATAQELKDPWREAIQLRVPGENGAPFAVVSLGADRKAGGEGVDKDIVKP